MKALLPLSLVAVVVAGCGSSSEEATNQPGQPPASLSNTTAEPKKGGSQAMIAPGMEPAPGANHTAAPFQAGSALKGK